MKFSSLLAVGGVIIGAAAVPSFKVDIDIEQEPLHTNPNPGCNSQPIKAQSFQHSKAELTPVNLGYEIHHGTFNHYRRLYNFSNIRFGQDTAETRFKPPLKPKTVNDPPHNYGNESSICIQTQVGWGAAAVPFLVDWAIPGPLDPKWLTEPSGPPSQKPNLDTRPSEDCLFLDVIVPQDVYNNVKNSTEGAPVMVWFYGGGYIFGDKQQSGEPSGLIHQAGADGFIFVAMNYRLGAYGWLAGSDFKADGGVENVGLYDQRLALEWVQEHIHKFGGNPNNVTAMGQSAGASSILHHITAFGGAKGSNDTFWPSPAPLFKRAILRSPGYFPQPDPEKLNLTYHKFLESAGVSALDEVDAGKAFRANNETLFLSPYGSFTYGPVKDGTLVPKLPGALLEEGMYHPEVDIFLGYDLNEGLLFTPPYAQDNDQFKKVILSIFPNMKEDIVQEVVDWYPERDFTNVFDPPKGPISRLARAMGEIVIECNTHYIAKAFGSRSNVYMYTFGYFPAIHGQDLLFTFYPEPPRFRYPLPIFWRKMAHSLQRYIADFVTHGTPDPIETDASHPAFPNYGNEKKVVTFANMTAFQSTDKVDAARCDWWQKLEEKFGEKKRSHER